MDEPKRLPIIVKFTGLNLRQAELPKDSWVLLQYSDQNNELYELVIPLLEGFHLLDLLETMIKKGGYDDLRQHLREQRKMS